ncbi:MAG: protein kinase [Armatimonadetes bacterium]|nr:protein kinase [Armatimonadota bacterium]
MLLRPGDLLEGKLDTYQIAATISRGAYGCAFRARTSDGTWRVVKQFEPSEYLSAADHAYQRKCFEREAAILTRFTSPLMVRGHELIQRDDEIYLVMEHVQGQTLRTILDQQVLTHGRPFSAPTVVGIGLQLCDALDALHQLPGQVIYRDLKPSNVLWDAVGQRLCLVDFGTARFNAAAQQATQGLGTEGYAPPELYSSHAVLSPATDVYTIGAVLYELATGEPPGRAAPEHFRGYDERLPEGLRAVIRTALQPEPALRFPTAADMHRALAAEGLAGYSPPFRLPAKNHHPLLACYCPVCAAEPRSDDALYCGRDGALYHVAMLQVFPAHRPPMTLYLDRKEAVLGRSDPERGFYPDLDLSGADPAKHLSRRHATIVREGLDYRLVVHPSTNPTRIDGLLAPPASSHPIAPGVRIELADLVAVPLLKPVLDEPLGPAGAEP